MWTGRLQCLHGVLQAPLIGLLSHMPILGVTQQTYQVTHVHYTMTAVIQPNGVFV